MSDETNNVDNLLTTALLDSVLKIEEAESVQSGDSVHRQEDAENKDRQKRSDAVSYDEVVVVCERIKASLGDSMVTVRSVRQALGRGSMTTIHNHVSAWLQNQRRLKDTAGSLDQDTANALSRTLQQAVAAAVQREREEKNARISALEEALANKDAEIALLLGQMEEAQSEIDATKAWAMEEADKTQEGEVRIVQLSEEISRLNLQLVEASHVSSGQLKEIESLAHERDKLVGQLTEIKSNLEAIQLNAKEWRELASKTAEDLGNARDSQAMMASEIAILKTQLDNALNGIEQVIAKSEFKDRELTEALEKNACLQSDLASLNAMSSAKQSQLDSFIIDISSLKKEIEELKNVNVSLTRENVIANYNIGIIQSNLEKANKQIESANDLLLKSIVKNDEFSAVNSGLDIIRAMIEKLITDKIEEMKSFRVINDGLTKFDLKISRIEGLLKEFAELSDRFTTDPVVVSDGNEH